MDSFSTKSLALQAQKKLMSKMATKSVANLFIDDTSSEVLDELYRVTKEYTRNRKESQKIIKNLIKMVVKLGVLYRNNQFNGEELILVENFRWAGDFYSLLFFLTPFQPRSVLDSPGPRLRLSCMFSFRGCMILEKN